MPPAGSAGFAASNAAMIAVSCAAVIVPFVTSASRTLLSGLAPPTAFIPPIDGRVVVATVFAECDVVAAVATPNVPTVSAVATAPATSDDFFIFITCPLVSVTTCLCYYAYRDALTSRYT